VRHHNQECFNIVVLLSSENDVVNYLKLNLFGIGKSIENYRKLFYFWSLKKKKKLIKLKKKFFYI